MWWINRFGSVSGPYSDEQVERGIKQLKFTKLHKISSDRQNWRRICDTEFWKPVSAAPEEMEIPTSLGLKSAAAPITYGGDEQVAPPTQPSSAKKSSVADFVRRHKIGIAIGTGTVAASLLVSLLLLAVFSGKGGGGSQDPDFESIKKKIVLMRGKRSNGTGFLVKMGGKKYVMTNDHVARGAEECVFFMLMIYMQNKNIPSYLEKSNYEQEKNAGRRAVRMIFFVDFDSVKA